MAFNKKSRGSRGPRKFDDSFSFDSRPKGRFDSNSRFGAPKDSRSFGGKRDFKQDNRFLMHAAVCAQCSNACEVPFKPFPGQAVLCNNCFSKDGVNAPSKSFSRNNAPRPGNSAPTEVPQVLKLELNQIHSKIDKILSIVQKLAASEISTDEVNETLQEVAEVEKEVKSVKKSFTPKLFRKK